MLILLRIASPPVSRAVKTWQARRLAAEASALIEQQDWTAAARKIDAALRLRPAEPLVWQANARLLSRIGGHGALALEWWKQIAQTRPLSLEDRRDYAAAALSANELELASSQMDIVFAQKAALLPKDFLLAGQLAALRDQKTLALDYANRISGDPRSGPRELLSATLLVFYAANPGSPAYSDACQRLVKLARDPANPLSLEALTLLARQPGTNESTGTHAPAFPVTLPETMTSLISRQEIAERLDSNPRARPYHRMLALEVKARGEPARADQYITQAVERFGHGDDETLAALGDWLYARHQFETMLKLLPFERSARTRELFLERLDALGSLGRYAEMKDMLLAEQSVIDQALQHMFLAVARGKLGETVGSANEWERALGFARSPQALAIIAAYAENNSALEIADQAHLRTIDKQPGLRSPYAARMRLAEAMGRTANAQEIAARIIQLWPDDVSTRIHEIYLRLLLGISEEETKAAQEEAANLVARNLLDGKARETLALAYLKQGKNASALEVLPQPGPGVPPSPVLAAAWAANGWQDKAREEAQKLATTKLLPEESALIAPLLKKSN